MTNISMGTFFLNKQEGKPLLDSFYKSCLYKRKTKEKLKLWELVSQKQPERQLVLLVRNKCQKINGMEFPCMPWIKWE